MTKVSSVATRWYGFLGSVEAGLGFGFFLRLHLGNLGDLAAFFKTLISRIDQVGRSRPVCVMRKYRALTASKAIDVMACVPFLGHGGTPFFRRHRTPATS